MADIAEIGFRAQTAELKAAKISLDALTPSANKAERSAEELAAAFDSQAVAAARGAAANNNLAASNRAAAGGMNPITRIANDNAAGMNRASLSTANLAAQFQDIGVSAAMGMSPLQIALQQGTQISAVLGPLGAAGAVKGLGAAFLSVISPVSLVVIAMVSLVAAGLQFINWAKLAKSALQLLAEGLETIAPVAAVAAAGLALLYGPAIVAGIVSIIALLGRMTVSAVTAAAAMAAANPAGAIVLGIVAAVAAVNIFRDELAKIFGRDIVKDAKNALNFVIAAFVGGFNGITAVWAKLPSVIGEITYSTVNLFLSGIEMMVNKATELIDKVILQANKIPGVNLDQIGAVSVGRIENPYEGSGKGVADAFGGAVKEAQKVDYVGNFTNAIAEGASKASEKLRELADGIDLTSAKDAKAQERAKAKYQDIVQGAQATIAANQAEAAALGMSAEAAARLKYETQLLNEAKQKDIELTAAQRGELLGLAADMAASEVATKQSREAFDFARDSVKGFVSDLRSGLKQGESFWDALGNAANNVLDKITDKLLNDVVDALFEVNNAGAVGGGGSGGFFSSIMTALFSAKGNVFTNNGVHAFAKGGAFTNSLVSKPTPFTYAKGGSFGVMGEAGPEAIMPLKRGPDGSLGVQMHSALANENDSKGGGNVYVSIEVNGNAKVEEKPPERMDNGDQMRRFIITTVSEATVNGEFDQAQSRFGNRPKRVLR